MTQGTGGRIRDQVNLLQSSPQLPFCDLLDSASVWQALAAEGIKFRERVFTPLVTLWMFLSQVLSADHSCREAVARFIAYMTARGDESCSPETDGYCKARKRLPLGVVSRLVRQSAEDLETHAPDSWLWHGRHVYMVDGTTVSMPDTKANQAEFPKQSGQAPGLGFPLARVVALISLATGAVRDLAIGPYKGKETGETALFRTLWDRLRQGDVILGDRYFASYFGLAGLVARGVDGLMRMHQLRKVDFRRGRRIGVLDHVVRWTKPTRPEWMDDATYERMPDSLEFRELRIRVTQVGFRVDELVFVTTMLDSALYSRETLADLYLERWNVELDLRSIKDVMQMGVPRCKTPAMVTKEVWVHLLAYNLIRGLMSSAAEAHEKLPRRLSFKGTLQALNTFRDALAMAPASRRDELVDSLLKTIAAFEVGDRPGRVEPRAIKRRPKPHRLLKEPRDQARKRLQNRR